MSKVIKWVYRTGFLGISWQFAQCGGFCSFWLPFSKNKKDILALESRHEPLAFISWDSYLLEVSIKKGLIKQIRPDQAYVVSKARKGIE